MVTFKTTGERPTWLKDEDLVRQVERGVFWSATTDWDWSIPRTFELHPCHWAVPVLEASLTPWAGTTATGPKDFDPNGKLMLRDGDFLDASLGSLTDWDWDWRDGTHPRNIIGYSALPQPARPGILVPIMTESEVRDLAVELSWPPNAFVAFARHLGILKPNPSPEDRVIERFPSLTLSDISTIREILKI